MAQDNGAPLTGQALAVPVEPASSLAPTGFDPSREPYENRLTIEDLRREVRELWDREAAFVRDLRNLPECPSTDTMRLLSHAGLNFHGIPAWELGKELQRKTRAVMRDRPIDCFDIGQAGVPFKCEYECGAGLWVFIRNAIAMEARRAETGTGSVHDSAAIAQGDEA
jgi:hypothetical protein